MRELHNFPPMNLRDHLRHLRGLARDKTLHVLFTRYPDLGDASVGMRVFVKESEHDSVRWLGMCRQMLVLPYSQDSMVRARHARLLQEVIRRYGQVGVEMKCPQAVTGGIGEVLHAYS